MLPCWVTVAVNPTQPSTTYGTRLYSCLQEFQVSAWVNWCRKTYLYVVTCSLAWGPRIKVRWVEGENLPPGLQLQMQGELFTTPPPHLPDCCELCPQSRNKPSFRERLLWGISVTSAVQRLDYGVIYRVMGEGSYTVVRVTQEQVHHLKVSPQHGWKPTKASSSKDPEQSVGSSFEEFLLGR